jgi:hypothetical protein
MCTSDVGRLFRTGCGKPFTAARPGPPTPHQPRVPLQRGSPRVWEHLAAARAEKRSQTPGPIAPHPGLRARFSSPAAARSYPARLGPRPSGRPPPIASAPAHRLGPRPSPRPPPIASAPAHRLGPRPSARRRPAHPAPSPGPVSEAQAHPAPSQAWPLGLAGHPSRRPRRHPGTSVSPVIRPPLTPPRPRPRPAHWDPTLRKNVQSSRSAPAYWWVDLQCRRTCPAWPHGGDRGGTHVTARIGTPMGRARSASVHYSRVRPRGASLQRGQRHISQASSRCDITIPVSLVSGRRARKCER